MSHRITFSCVQRWLFLSGALLAGTLAQAQNLNVTAANASNDAIYTVNFANQTISIENTDQGSLHSIRSLTFTPNGANDQVDLLAADNAGGLIVRYCGNFNPNASPPANTFGVSVWNNTEGGPTNPDGLSVDSAGNLFLVNQGSGTSTNPQVWVIQGLATNCQTVPAPAPTKITLIDSKFNAKQTLEETLIARTPIFLTGAGAAVTQINPGDLLVLTSNPASVILYRGSNGLGPTGTKNTQIVLLNGSNFPAGTQPGGMDFLPTDNSLLVTTSTGTVFRFTVDQIVPTTGTPQTFVSGLGNGQFKVRTGQQNGSVFAFVANNNGGDIFEFNSSGALLSTVTTNVQHPQGLAVTNTAYQPFASCSQTCDVLGDNSAAKPLLNHLVNAPAVTGNILENMCVVLTDPRVAQYGSCTAAATAAGSPYANGLPVAQVCGAGFDNPNNPLVIPNSMCGASGTPDGVTQGSGFTLVKTLTAAYSGAGFPFNGTFIETDSDFSGLPTGPSDPSCAAAPFQVAGWAPLAGEGVNPGGKSVVDVVNGCATPHSGGGTLSLWVLGMDLNTGIFANGLADFAATEYTTLLNTVTAETKSVAIAPSTFVLTPPGGGNFTSQLQQCIKESQGAFQNGAAFYAGAAQELLIADHNVAMNAYPQSLPPFTPPFTPDSDYPNPSGLLRALLESTHFTVDVRLGGNASNAPPANPPPMPSTTTPVNITPTITGTPSPTVSNGSIYTFNPATADFAGNTATLTYSLTGLPWAKLSIVNNNQVQVSGKAKKQGSPFSPVLTVTDGCGVSTQLSWTLTVN